MVAARRGSPLLIGVKSNKKVKLDFVDVTEEEVAMGNFFKKKFSKFFFYKKKVLNF